MARFKIIFDGEEQDEVFATEEEKREPVLIPNFSAHSLSHTFCTRLCDVVVKHFCNICG